MSSDSGHLFSSFLLKDTEAIHSCLICEALSSTELSDRQHCSRSLMWRGATLDFEEDTSFLLYFFCVSLFFYSFPFFHSSSLLSITESIFTQCHCSNVHGASTAPSPVLGSVVTVKNNTAQSLPSRSLQSARRRQAVNKK